MILVRRIRGLLVPLRLQAKLLSLVLYATSRYFFPLRIYSPRVRRWSALDNAPPPITARTSSALPHWELKYSFCADVTRFRSPITSFFTGIVLRDPMMWERFFVFPKKRQGKFFSRIIFSTPAICVSRVPGDVL